MSGSAGDASSTGTRSREGVAASPGARRWLRALAPAKINLGLFVGPIQDDGRHELVSVMQSISLADELSLETASAPAGMGPGESGEDEVLCPGLDVPAAENLAARALAAFRAASGWHGGALRVAIVKRVPVAGGLGGGSADAAAALRLAMAASGLTLERSQLLQVAVGLGGDVPAQIAPGRWLAGGVGERLGPLPAPRPRLGVLVLPAAARLRTAEVYARADELRPPRASAALRELREALRAALARGEPLPPRELLHNDLEAAALALCPEIADALADARAAGCDHAMVSGSGPTAIGLFAGADGLERAQRAATGLAARTPRPLVAAAVDARFGAPHPADGRSGCQNPGGPADAHPGQAVRATATPGQDPKRGQNG